MHVVDPLTCDIHVDPLTWGQLGNLMRHDKSCWVQSPHDLLLHAILLHDMDRGLTIQAKQTYKVDRCPFPVKHKTNYRLWLACVQCTVHTCVNVDKCYS